MLRRRTCPLTLLRGSDAMKRIILFVSWVSAIWLACASVSASEDRVVTPADRYASLDVVKVLTYISGLTDRSEKRVLSGQHCGRGVEVAEQYRTNVTEIAAATGHKIALIGTDYGRGRTDAADPDAAAANRILIQHWRAGGLVTVTWHCVNPWTDQPAWNRKIGSLDELVTPGSRVRATWMAQLDRIADALAELQAAGVVVIWRPFHEMNGGWFWWGRRTPEQFRRLWHHMFRFYTQERELHNLLWCWSPSATASTPAVDYYPGSDYCDLVGLDYYGDELEMKWYEDVASLGKPFGLGEVGPKRGSRGSFDYSRWIHAFRERYPDICYFQAWSWEWAMAANKNAKILLTDPLIVGRNDLDWRGR